MTSITSRTVRPRSAILSRSTLISCCGIPASRLTSTSVIPAHGQRSDASALREQRQRVEIEAADLDRQRPRLDRQQALEQELPLRRARAEPSCRAWLAFELAPQVRRDLLCWSATRSAAGVSDRRMLALAPWRCHACRT
jgi:hypothetical protein